MSILEVNAPKTILLTQKQVSKDMFEFSKSILQKVSFDRRLFRKELVKAIRGVKVDERTALKTWCLATFINYQDVILESFNQVAV